MHTGGVETTVTISQRQAVTQGGVKKFTKKRDVIIEWPERSAQSDV